MKTKLLTLAISLSLVACATTTEPELTPETPSGIPTLKDAFHTGSDMSAGTAPAASESGSKAAPDASVVLNQLFQGYFMEGLELNPISGTFLGMRQYNSRWVNSLNQEYRDKTHDYAVKWLDRLTAIDRDSLAGQDRISYDILRYQLKQGLEGEQFPDHLVPIHQFFNLASFIATLGSGQSAQPFANVEDYHNWLKRTEGVPVVFDQAIENMRDGIQQGVVQPRVLMEKVLPQLSAHMVDSPTDSIFWQPIANLPEDIGEQDREALSKAYRDMIENRLVPAYRKLHDFIRDEYLPAARDDVGMWAMPGGADWYNFRIKTQTTTDLTADEIHAFGLSEVARIRSEMEDVARQVGFDGPLLEFFAWLKANDDLYFTDEEALLQGYRDLQHKVNERLPKLFDIEPKADYEVRAVEAFRAASSAGASYQRAAPDGSRPGIFYVNTHNLRAQPKYGMETLSLHEASPGHHFQISIQQEIENMPMFRRFGGFTAFAEGWALYAESIGREMGMFEDPYQYFGRLSDEMLRAMRLVVDTGMHAKGWTREQAIAFMMENSDMAESDVVAEVERYIAIAGQALAYKVGQRVISQLRHDAEQALGDDFDIRAFHRLVLTGGSMPMDVLGRRVGDWIASQ